MTVESFGLFGGRVRPTPVSGSDGCRWSRLSSFTLRRGPGLFALALADASVFTLSPLMLSLFVGAGAFNGRDQYFAALDFLFVLLFVFVGDADRADAPSARSAQFEGPRQPGRGFLPSSSSLISTLVAMTTVTSADRGLTDDSTTLAVAPGDDGSKANKGLSE